MAIKKEKDHNVLEIDPQAAMMIRKIFEWRIQRHSAEKIANYLNQLAVPSPYRYKQLRQEAFYTDFAQKRFFCGHRLLYEESFIIKCMPDICNRERVKRSIIN